MKVSASIVFEKITLIHFTDEVPLILHELNDSAIHFISKE